MRSITCRIRPAYVVIALLVLLLMAGSATAGSLITGKQVRDGSLTGKDIKDRSITARDLAKGVAGRPGATGPRGETGPAGPAGPPGTATGPAGGALTGAYPNPGLATGAVTADALAALPVVRAEGPARTCTPPTPSDVPSSGAMAALRWTREVFDTAGSFTSCSHVLWAPRPGYYQVTAAVEWPSAGDTSARSLAIRLVGGSVIGADTRLSLPTRSTRQTVSTLTYLDETDGGVEIWASQESPGALTLDQSLGTSFVTMQFVGNR